MDEIIVSVIMTCYNHEKYVSNAIRGVIMQKTNFKYEVFVHDDASTDKSALIIKEFEEKNPELIRGIYQKTNQYSQHVDIVNKYVMPLVRGKYIAVCECDDFWCDPLKLQKQVDILRKNPDYSGCGCNCFIIDKNDSFVDVHRSVYRYLPSHLFSLGELATGVFPGQTCSLMYKKELMKIDDEKKMAAFQSFRTSGGDNQRNIQLLLNGPIYYMDDVMVAHRVVLDEGDSWSARHRGRNMSLEIFLLSRDLRHYARIFYSRLYLNYYATWHSGVACIFKYMLNRNTENKNVFDGAVKEIGNTFFLVLYCIVVGVLAVPSFLIGKCLLPREKRININELKDVYQKQLSYVLFYNL